jgi:glycosyltransferase involved in cell wall biosynthesis
MDLIIVPSTFTKQTFEASGKLTTPIIVIPESFSDAVKENVESKFDFSTPFNFLIVSQMTGNNPENDRKNILYTLKWICEQFRNDTQVGIVLKTNASRNTKIDRNVVLNAVGQALSQVRVGPNPKVHIVHGQLSDSEVASLYRHPKIKALVSATRGEGYGLPLVEAAASGLPVIATNWSGHLDFLNQGRFLSVDYSLVPVHQSRIDGQIFVQGSKWAQPDEADFKKVIRNFKHNPTVGKQWASDLQKKVLEKFSFEAVSKLYDEATKEIL